MVTPAVRLPQLWAWLAEIPDPEIPAISIVELGIVRDVAWVERGSRSPSVRVTITPTYSGCPAVRVIQRDIVAHLEARGVAGVVVDVTLSPAWTTDWIGPAAREKLRAYGISSPLGRPRPQAGTIDLLTLLADDVRCPRCASDDVEMLSRFGSTPCKSLHRCRACKEPFDHFKSH